MTQEEKLEEAKRLYETANADQRYVLESLFPELVESENERIRKELIEHVKDQQSSFISAPDCRDKYEEEENNKYNSWIAWLEKQGEQKPQRMISAEAKEVMYGKPAYAWSEEDEKILKDILVDVKFEGYNNDMLANSYKKINWLKSLKQRIGE